MQLLAVSVICPLSPETNAVYWFGVIHVKVAEPMVPLKVIFPPPGHGQAPLGQVDAVLIPLTERPPIPDVRFARPPMAPVRDPLDELLLLLWQAAKARRAARAQRLEA